MHLKILEHLVENSGLCSGPGSGLGSNPGSGLGSGPDLSPCQFSCKFFAKKLLTFLCTKRAFFPVDAELLVTCHHVIWSVLTWLINKKQMVKISRSVRKLLQFSLLTKKRPARHQAKKFFFFWFVKNAIFDPLICQLLINQSQLLCWKLISSMIAI